MIATIPGALEGRAKDWFACHSMPMEQMRTVDGWIQALKGEFIVNTAIAREQANSRKYNSSDESVLKYFYAKINLLRTVREDMPTDMMVDEIWLGLPAALRMTLNYDEIKLLAQKDLSYRETFKYSKDRREPRREGKDRERDRYGRWDRRSFPEKGTTIKEKGDHEKRSDRKDRGKGRVSNGGKKEKWKGIDDKRPEPLPRDQWREDDKGRTMTRKCRYCSKWHMDFDCPNRPTSYNLSVSYDQWPSSDESDREHESDESSSDTSSDDDRQTGYRTAKDIAAITYHNVYSNTPVDQGQDEVRVPRAGKYRVEELPAAFAVGTGVSYLSAQPCPVTGRTLAPQDRSHRFRRPVDHRTTPRPRSIHHQGVPVTTDLWRHRQQQDPGQRLCGVAYSPSKLRNVER